MKHYYEDGGLRLFHGSNKDILPTFEAESYDSIVTDPPYELGFMGKGWDSSGIAYDVEMWRECWRVLKPGGHLLAFGGTRTWHRIATAIEDAGFEIRGSVAWLYGQGFPKSMNVGADKSFCQCPEGESKHGESATEHAVRVVRDGDVPSPERALVGAGAVLLPGVPESGASAAGRSKLPGTEAWGGEPSVAGRSDVQAEAGELRAPADGSVPSGVRLDDESERLRALASIGDGAVDRTPSDEGGVREPQGPRHVEQRTGESGALPDEQGPQARRGWPVCGGCGKPQVRGWGTALKPAFEPIIVARKPLVGNVAANVLAYGTGAINIDATRIGTDGGTKAVDFGEMAGTMYGGGKGKPRNAIGTLDGKGRFPPNVLLDASQAAELDRQAPSTGGSGKASGLSLREPTGAGVAFGARNGLAGEPAFYGGDKGGASRFFPTFRYEAKAPGSERPEVDGVAHATVKPLDLMRWLVRLVTRRGGRVLDPFAGSGTTGEAALLEGMEAVLIELEETHLPLILQRVRKPLQPSMFGDWEETA